MTYLLISLPFLVVTLGVVLASARRPGLRRRLAASAGAAVVLVLLTAVFDNIMIGAGLYSYPEHLVSGIRIGLAPIEDFAYPLCLAFGLPAVLALLPSRRTPVSRSGDD